MEIEEKNPAVGVIGFAGSSLRLEHCFWGIQLLLPADPRCLPRSVPTKSRSVSTAGSIRWLIKRPRLAISIAISCTKPVFQAMIPLLIKVLSSAVIASMYLVVLPDGARSN